MCCDEVKNWLTAGDCSGCYHANGACVNTVCVYSLRYLNQINRRVVLPLPTDARAHHGQAAAHAHRHSRYLNEHGEFSLLSDSIAQDRGQCDNLGWGSGTRKEVPSRHTPKR